MWLKRILYSLIGVRSKAELENDLKKGIVISFKYSLRVNVI